MKHSFMSLMFLIIILAAFGYFISKAMKYKTEREKAQLKKDLLHIF